MPDELSQSEANGGTTQPGIASSTVQNNLANNGIHQIRGTAVANSTSTGVPKQVTNVGVTIKNGQKGATSAVTVQFRRDPSDKNFAGVTVYVKGYQGNSNPTQVAAGSSSPITFPLNNTGEKLSFVVQSYGNSGNAPLNASPSAGGTLPKSTTGGYGTTTVISYNNSNPPPASILTLGTSGQGWFIGPGILDIGCTINSFNAPITNYSANTVLVQQFVLHETWTLSKVAYKLHSGTASTHFNFGIYSAAGNKLIDSGAFDGSITTVQTNSFTATVLPAGVYYFAFSATSTSPTGMAIQVGSVTVTDFLLTIATPKYIATAANSTSTNVMPATLGTLTAASSSSFQSLPLCIWQV